MNDDRNVAVFDTPVLEEQRIGDVFGIGLFFPGGGFRVLKMFRYTGKGDWPFEEVEQEEQE